MSISRTDEIARLDDEIVCGGGARRSFEHTMGALLARGPGREWRAGYAAVMGRAEATRIAAEGKALAADDRRPSCTAPFASAGRSYNL